MCLHKCQIIRNLKKATAIQAPRKKEKRHAKNRCLPLAFSSNPKLLFRSLESSLELVNASAGINKLLLTGKEGMALRANFYSHLSARGGLRRYGLAASTLDNHFFVIRMDSGLHFIYTSLYLQIFTMHCIISQTFRKCKGF